MMLAFSLALLVLLSDAPATPYAPLASRGFVTDRATAERAIGFRPFVPDPHPVQVALVPPFHGEQLSANEGIAYAYGRRGRDWIVQEWPRNGGSLAAFAALPAERRCADVHAIGGTAKLRGIAWTTPRGIVMTLTPDGAAEPRTILGEFRRLVRRGACR